MRAHFVRKIVFCSALVAAFLMLPPASVCMADLPETPYGGVNGARGGASEMYTEWKENFFEGTGADYGDLPSNRPGHGSDLLGEVGCVAGGAEIEAYLDALRARAGGVMQWRNVYRYNAVGADGRPEEPVKTLKLPLVVFSREGVFEPEDVKALGRPVVWLQGGVHGDEASGGESMLAAARRLAVGDLRYILDRVVVVMLPRFNPEGAWRGRRGNNSAIPAGGEEDQDPNRDHLWFEQTLVRAVHKVINAYNPHIFLDQHEMDNTVTRDRAYTADGALADAGSTTDWAFDLAVCHAPNPALSGRARDLGYKLFEPRWRRDLDAKRIRWSIYALESGRRTVDAMVLSTDMRTFVPGRRELLSWALECDADPRQDSSYALKGGWSVLTETPARGRPRGLLGMRTYAQDAFLESLLRTTFENARYVRDQIELGRREMIEKGRAVSPANTITLGYRYAEGYGDPAGQPETYTEHYLIKSPDANGEPVTVEISGDVRYGRSGAGEGSGYVPASVITQPYAYIFEAEEATVDRLAHTGVEVHRLTEDTELRVSAFRVNAVVEEGVYNELSCSAAEQPNTFKVKCGPAEERTVAFPRGTYVMYTAQVRAPLGAMALDPESCFNYAHLWAIRAGKGREGLLPAAAGEDFPVYRLMRVAALPAEALPNLGEYWGAETPHALPLGEEAPFLAAVAAAGADSPRRAIDLLIPNDGIAGEIRGGRYTLSAQALRGIYRAMGGDGRYAAGARWFFLGRDGEIGEAEVRDGAIALDMSRYGLSDGGKIYVRAAAAAVSPTPES